MKRSKSILTNDGFTEINENNRFVTFSDPFLSGWGLAEGRVNKVVVICDDWHQAQQIFDGIKNTKNQRANYLNITDKLPYYSPSKYKVSYYIGRRCSLWLKNSGIK